MRGIERGIESAGGRRACCGAGKAIEQLWLFLLVPSIAGLLVAWLFKQRILAP